MKNEWMQVGLALLFIVGLILILAWLARRISGLGLTSSKGFQLIASMMLGPKEKVMLVQVGGRYLLMGVGSSTVTILYDFGQELPQGFDSDNKQNLASLFKSSVRKP
jgi:flagellar protein FliO/FliZ